MSGHPQNFSIIELDEVDSTNLEARRRVRKGAQHGTIVLAHTQTAGRGRLDRKWASAAGGLYATFILRPPEISNSFILGLAVHRELLKYNIAASVKWPNDVLIGSKKIAGILGEIEKDALCLGLGLNVNQDLETIKRHGLEHIATSMVLEIKRDINRAEKVSILENIAAHFLSLDSCSRTELVSEWKKSSETIGQRVRVQTGNEEIEGMAIDLGKNFELIVDTDEGPVKILAGDCLHLRRP